MHRNVEGAGFLWHDHKEVHTYNDPYNSIQFTYENELQLLLTRKTPIKHEVEGLLNPSTPYFGPFRSLAWDQIPLLIWSVCAARYFQNVVISYARECMCPMWLGTNKALNRNGANRFGVSFLFKKQGAHTFDPINPFSCWSNASLV